MCGATGSSKVAERQAAIETLKAGFDRYIIVGADSANNVRTMRTGGTYNTTGTVYGNQINATTTYTPGPIIAAGRHDTAFSIKMFKDGDPGASRAISARSTLGPNWANEIKRGAMTTC